MGRSFSSSRSYSSSRSVTVHHYYHSSGGSGGGAFTGAMFGSMLGNAMSRPVYGPGYSAGAIEVGPGVYNPALVVVDIVLGAIAFVILLLLVVKFGLSLFSDD